MKPRTIRNIGILISVVSIILFIGGFKYIDETALYYFFSTIAQTMGALLGVLGAFTVFRIQQLEHELINLTGIFVNFLQTAMAKSNSNADICGNLYKSISDNLRHKDYQEIIDKYHKAFNQIQEVKELIICYSKYI